MKILGLILFLLPILTFSDHVKCRAFFSPDDHIAGRLIELIDGEEKSMKVAIYSIFHTQIADALIRAKKRGVVVEVLVDPFSVKVRSSIHKLLNAQIPLFVWDRTIRVDRGRKRALMHDKFAVFGREKVWTGSFDFTHDSHLRHRENVVVIESGEIARRYLEHFNTMRLYESRPYAEYIALHPKPSRKKRGRKTKE